MEKPVTPMPEKEKDEGLGASRRDSGDTTGISNGDQLESSSATLKEAEKTDGGPLAPTTTDDYVYLTGFKLFIVLFAVTIVAFLMLLDTSIIVTVRTIYSQQACYLLLTIQAIPRITSDFHSLDDVGWYGAAYLIASCSLQPLAGKLYTYYSSKWMFLIFVFIFELGSLICGVATNSDMLIIGRAIAGIGTSGIMNGAFTILGACVPMHKLPCESTPPPPILSFNSLLRQSTLEL
jgi:hypothetical protein